MLSHSFYFMVGVCATAFHILGAIAALHAIMRTRTSQGAIAWALGLVTFPYLTFPLYLIFGRNRFMGYVKARREEGRVIEHFRQGLALASLEPTALPPAAPAVYGVFDQLADMPFGRGNEARLLVDGEATFGAVFEGIDAAREYILVQFFIVHDDTIGRALKERLMARARAGVRVYFLYDEVGSHGLPRKYIRELEAAGVRTHWFISSRDLVNRFQVNFRNHRKIVVVDGDVAYVGGLNVGDEYLGKNPRFGHWRDTHVEVRGPAVKAVQLAFLDDWHWSTSEVPPLRWNLEGQKREDGQAVLVLPSGPADDLDTCSLMFLHAINAAQKRIWITSPYFVPDAPIVQALQLAVMRGVDVRIILPSKMDHIFVYLASFSYLKDTIPYGVKLYRYQDGFLHQKVLLIDDFLSSVGTANFDNRSFRLNFEITLVFADKPFAAQVEKMLEEDLTHCRPLLMTEITDRHFPFRLAVQFARLLSPVL